ncbi:YlbF family regulator [Halolamina sp. CBA1230]|uniref:YlbF family regulator n=1 Tax=Halolamina sp. CBA1230 TaxID=1853690 RepID=UPI0009A144B8|nr:YlbF family regulator [Halolamina sp. CBA1230]QKY19525.1 YlbF family regulator [Halolamina sp. CBA1230]
MSVAKTVEDLGAELGERIAATDEYQRFEEAKRAVEESEEAQQRIAEFESLRAELTTARQTGEADQELVDDVRQAQHELHSLPEMAEYLEAQEAFQARLDAVNDAISSELVVDFGGEAGGCCQD